MTNLKKLLAVISSVAVFTATVAYGFTNTPNYDFILPAVNDPVDADAWGGYLNDNWTSLDSLLATDFAGLGANNTFTGTNTFNQNIKFATGKGILDANGNELLLTTTTTSAITYFNITNSATGAGPILSCLGETNTDCQFQANGTGGYNFKATATAATLIKLYEDTDNGTNHIGLKSPDSVAGDADFTLPAADGTSGQFLQTNGSKVLSFATPTPGIFTQAYEPAGITYANGTSQTVSHGLSGAPRLIFADFECVSAEGGYSAGDILYGVNTSGQPTSSPGTNLGLTLNVSSGNTTQINFRISDDAITLTTKSTGDVFVLTPAKWLIRIRAYR